MGVRLAISVREFRRKGEEEERKEKGFAGSRTAFQKQMGKLCPRKVSIQSIPDLFQL